MLRILLKRKIVTLLCFVTFAIFLTLRVFQDADTEKGNARDVGTSVHLSDVITPTSISALRNLGNTTTSIGLHRQTDILPTRFTNFPVPSIPGIYTYLPHLNSRPDKLIPKIRLSRGRSNVSIVIGIPSIRRPIGIYIFNTLQSLISGMNSGEKNDTLIILSIAEPWNETYGTHIIKQLSERFPTEIAQGLLEVILPHAEFYPDLDSLKRTLGDSQERVKWRSKQNLDYAFLIMHAWSRGHYYLQLEDDITAVPGFITSIKTAIQKNPWSWFSLEFSTLGFIARLFRSSDAAKMMEFLLMFYSSKPCDWLYDDFMRVKMCGHGENWSKCRYKILNVARSIRPSLFQHEGLRSSLQGHENKLKDSAFNTHTTSPVPNPPVETIITTLHTYSRYDIYSAYIGVDQFWGSNPKEGDIIDFLFDDSIKLSKVYIATGSVDIPNDTLKNATLEILPRKMPPQTSNLYKNKISSEERTEQQKFAYKERLRSNENLVKMSTNDTFFMVGEFNDTGISSFDIPEEAGEIWVLRIHIHAASDTWVLIKNISLQIY